MNATLDTNNLTKVRQTGLQALKKALGPVGMVRFIQQFDTGSGNYTKEKYQQPDLTLEDMDAILKSRR